MAAPQHYVIIGNGVAGNEAAFHLRRRDEECRITIVSAGRLLFYNRYELPRMFSEACDWRDFLVHAPQYYEENRIDLRRNTVVANVDAIGRTLQLGHKEQVTYDKLLVASGGGAYLPAELADCAHLLVRFHNYRDACALRDTLPSNGTVVMLGGDVLGLDLARNLVDRGYGVTVIATEQLFWPHRVPADDRPVFVEALRKFGVAVIEDGRVGHVDEGAKGMSARRVLLTDGRELFADAVMPFFGLIPTSDFMMGSGVDMERGLLVQRDLHTTDSHIWAAGDVCQIWSSSENSYQFYYGWKNVKRMGEIAARNMTGDEIDFDTAISEKLTVDDDGQLSTPYWEHD